MELKTITFPELAGRKEELERIERFNMYPVMYYRTNVFIHSQRVRWITEELVPPLKQAFNNFDAELARILALVHDDAEVITGDVQLGHKLQMSAEELAGVDRKEQEAIEILSKRFPQKINGFPYKQLLTHALKKDIIEAQAVSLADKLDAYGESMHELLAGNADFIPPCQNYTRILANFGNQFPQLRRASSGSHPLLISPLIYEFQDIALKGKPHTVEMINTSTNLPHYDFWKDLTIRKFGEQGVAFLITQREFH